MQTSSDRIKRRVSPRSKQRGAAGVFMAISLLLLVPILALAINIGQLYYAQRDLEKQATLAALSATQVASGCANDGTPGLLPAVTAEVTRIIDANNIGGTIGSAALIGSGINGFPGVEVGMIKAVGGLRTFVPLADGNPAVNAVRVNLTRPQPTPFLIPFGAVFGGGNLFASATAQQAAVGSFSVGSGLLSLNGGIVNGLLGGLLCAPGDTACQNSIISLNVVNSMTGLVNTQITLGQLGTAVGLSVTDLSDPLNLSLGLLSATPRLNDLLDGLVGALADDVVDPVVINLLRGLANAASNPGEVPLGQLLGAVNGLGGDTPIINLFDLLIALGQATVANPSGVTPIALPINLNVPGVAKVSVFLKVLEPPQLGLGRPGQAEAKTAQIRLLVRIEAGGILNGLLDLINNVLGLVFFILGGNLTVVPPPLNLGVDVAVASAAATLERIQCPRSGVNNGEPIVGIDAATATATVEVGTFSGSASSAPALSATGTLPLVSLKLLGGGLDLGLGLTSVGVGATAPAPLAPITDFTIIGTPARGQPLVYRADGIPPAAAVAANPQSISAPTTVSINLNLISTPTGSGLGGFLGGLLSAILNGVLALLNPLLALVNGLTTTLVDPLLSLLGIQLGKATVTMNAVQTGQPILVSTCLPGTALCP